MNPCLPPAFRLIDLDTVTSTNDVALDLARNGAAAWTMVRARKQTAGRGRQGRSFRSPEGNSYTSLILRPSSPITVLPQLGLVIGLAVTDAIREFAPSIPPALCKWPNDVLVGGAKVAGILVESSLSARLEAVVAGIGINLVNHPELPGVHATDLAAEGAASGDRDLLLGIVCRWLAERVGVWEASGFEALKDAWLERAAGIGRPATLVGKQSVDGLLAGIGEDGTLLLEANGALHSFVSGTLILKDAA